MSFPEALQSERAVGRCFPLSGAERKATDREVAGLKIKANDAPLPVIPSSFTTLC